MEKLKQPYTVLYDRKSRPEFGPVAEQFENQGSVKTELKNYFQKNVHAEVVGLFDFGTSFGIDGTLITSSVNFLRFTNQQPKGLINIGVIKLKPGIEIKSFIEKVNPYLPEDIRIFTREEFIKFEKKYWASTTPIGFIFSLGVTLGLIVGVVVVYQILYTNVSEYLPQYATLKAIGYKHQYLSIMVLQQSVFIAILGYIPGWLLSQLLYLFTKQATQLPIGMTLDRSLLVFTLAVFMCVFSALTAVKKLKEADPADIF
jgi:putative ABC transport system permease protein